MVMFHSNVKLPEGMLDYVRIIDIDLYNNHPKIGKTMDGGHQENSKSTNHRHIDWLNPRSISQALADRFFFPVSTKICLFSGSNSGWCPLMSWFVNPMKTSSLYLYTINHRIQPLYLP